MALGDDGIALLSLIHVRETLIAAGALIPASCPQNLRDINAEPSSDGERTLTDILLEMREDGRDDGKAALRLKRAATLAEVTSDAVTDEDHDGDRATSDGID